MAMSDMSKGAQLGAILLVVVLASVALYFGVFKRVADQNRLDRERLQAKLAEVQDLRKYENDLPRLNQQIASLKQQLEIQKRIVPDEKEADQFIHLLQNTAQSAGIEIRRWTAKDTLTREFYSEVPFDLELDGPYYSMLRFFEKVSKLERIINVSNLQIGSLRSNDSKYRKNYQYAPQESVGAVCTTTTFFSHDPVLAQAAAKPGATTPAAK